ncbi:MAG: ATP-binding protein [Limnohabitans sp.]
MRGTGRPRRHSPSRWFSRRSWRRGVLLRSLLALLAWIALLAIAADAFGAPALTDSPFQEQPQIITQATLRTASGERPVQLPHVLEPGDFAPEGSRVLYRMTVNVPDATTLRAIYIQKLSRSGFIRLNGRDAGSCGQLLLQYTRCHHQPQFFRTPYTNWQAGENTIEVELYATQRQTNGLSEVVVGPRETIYWHWFKPHDLLQVQTLDMLTWLTMAFGLLALVVFAVLRSERMYLWFGLANLLAALSKINILTTTPFMSIDLFDWSVFASRFLFSCAFGLTYLTYFRRERPWHVWAILSYAALALAAIWWSNSSPQMVSLLYAPVLLLGFTLAGVSNWWAWRSGTTGDRLMAFSFALMPLAGVFDFARLRGSSAFVGVYLLPYTSSLTLTLMGLGMIGRLALALRTTRDLSSILQTRVAEREAELLHSHQQIVEMEQTKARTAERERILRDMHDGFLSTLALTRTALASGRTTAQQARLLVTECMDDLRLMLEASAKDKGSLADVLADFFYRFENRLAGVGIEPSLDLQLEGMPPMDSATLLQLMRIVQESTNNVIRHSGAKNLNILAHWDERSGRLTLEVNDDGDGIPAETGSPGQGGRGLRNMRVRAEAIGAQLTFESDARGTRLRLNLQMPTA